jgi:hypothetical protein
MLPSLSCLVKTLYACSRCHEKCPYSLCLIRPSVRPYACIIGAGTGRIYVIFDTGDFMEICREIPDLVKVGYKYPDLCMKAQVIFTVPSDIK